jgi:hypothetical protein
MIACLIHVAGIGLPPEQRCVRCQVVLCSDIRILPWFCADDWVGEVYSTGTATLRSGANTNSRVLYRIPSGRELRSNESFCTPPEDSREWEQ